MAAIRKIFLISAVAALVSGTTGCAMYRLEELRHTTMSGTPFQNELARLYMDFATEEEKHYDWSDSWYFADKGLRLAYGKDAGPEDLAEWDIPASALPEMEKARAALVAALTPDLMRASPSRAASAQFYFDCWVEQQEENWQEEDIAYCRDNLMKALDDFNASGMHAAAPAEAAAKPAPVKKAEPKKLVEMPEAVPPEESAEPEVKEKPEPEVKEAPEPKAKKAMSARDEEAKNGNDVVIPESTSYAVFFESNRAEISEPGMNVITEIIKSLSGTSDYVVVLHTSKDRPGMAAERIHVVRKLLVAGGIKENAIKISSGKTEIETGKSVSRRVEIFLNE